MTWLAEYQDVKAVRDQAEKAMRIPLGMASPFWLAFGAAASVGVGWWWMSRWTQAANLEAMTKPLFKSPAPAPKVAVAAPVIAEKPVVAAPIVKEVVVEAAPAPVLKSPALVKADPAPAPKTAAVTPVAAEKPVVAAPIVKKAVVKAAPAPVAPVPSEPDDLTQLVGIGPKLADALAARGVTQFAQVAAWTDKDVARFDSELKLLGRAARNEWVAQAKRMVKG